jgi:mannose-6-phosphate isomerase-like protein (cupin superfamily)
MPTTSIIEFPDGERHEVLADDPDRLVIELVKPPGAGANPPHVHERSDEVLRVLEGRVRFRLGWAERELGPGDAVEIPRGAAHSWEVLGDEPLRARFEFTPGCGFHRFLRDYAALAEAGRTRRGRPGLRDFALLHRRHGRDLRVATLPEPLLNALVAAGLGLAGLTGRRLPQA